nr:MAG TPA: protein of unknown function (UPF0239) [Bacteriophage sp.]
MTTSVDTVTEEEPFSIRYGLFFKFFLSVIFILLHLSFALS